MTRWRRIRFEGTATPDMLPAHVTRVDVMCIEMALLLRGRDHAHDKGRELGFTSAAVGAVVRGDISSR